MSTKQKTKKDNSLEISKTYDIMELTIERILGMTLIDESAKDLLKSTSGIMGINYKAQTDKFQRDVILNEIEYPLPESKLVQSFMEIESRFGNIANFQHQYETGKIKLQRMDIQLKKLENERKQYHKGDVDGQLKQLDIEELILERDNEVYKLAQVVASAKQNMTELRNWKSQADSAMNELGVDSYEDPKLSKILYDWKEREIAQKTYIWGMLQQKGMLDMTPTKIPHILKNADMFKRGAEVVADQERRIMEASQRPPNPNRWKPPTAGSESGNPPGPQPTPSRPPGDRNVG